MNIKDRKFLISLLGFACLIISVFISISSNQFSNATNGILLAIGFTLINSAAIIIVGLYNYQSRQKKLRLEYHVKVNAPLVNTKDIAFPNADIVAKDKNGDFYIVTVKIQNSGTMSITPSDFKKEISLHFGDKAKILDVNILEKNPSGRKIEFMKEDHDLVIEPMLLNRKDTVTLAVLLKGVFDRVALIPDGLGITPEVLRR